MELDRQLLLADILDTILNTSNNNEVIDILVNNSELLEELIAELRG